MNVRGGNRVVEDKALRAFIHKLFSTKVTLLYLNKEVLCGECPFFLCRSRQVSFEILLFFFVGLVDIFIYRTHFSKSYHM